MFLIGTTITIFSILSGPTDKERIELFRLLSETKEINIQMLQIEKQMEILTTNILSLKNEYKGKYIQAARKCLSGKLDERYLTCKK